MMNGVATATAPAPASAQAALLEVVEKHGYSTFSRHE